MQKTKCYNKRTVCIMCASLILWILGTHAVTLPQGGENSATPYCQAKLFHYEPGDTPTGSDSVTERVGAEGDDPNEPNEPTWAEMADGTYFMIFIDLSPSMRSYDIDAINEATEMFIQFLSSEVYDGDLEEAIGHVIVDEVNNERYLQHMAGWNLGDPNATRYVNMSFTNEANLDYYTESIILSPTEHFIDDLEGNQDSGGFIYGLKNELTHRTFSIGKLFNVGGRQGNNLGGDCPVFVVHLYCTFNNVGGYADTNLSGLGISYDNIERGLAGMDILQYMIDTLDYSAAYITEEQTEDLSME